MTNTSLQIGDVYALQEKETGKWFTFQIIQTDKENAAHVDLDYWSEKMPVEKDLKKMSYLRINHHLWYNNIHSCWSPINFFPSHAILIGNMAVQSLGECKCYGSWTNGHQQKWTEKWNMLPKDQVTAYKEVDFPCNETVTIGGKELRKDLYGLFDETLSAVKDFSELDKFPRLGSICTAKDYPQLIPFLERRCLVHELVWNNCQRQELDLSHTHLNKLEISGSNIEVIHLPSCINKLVLKGKLSPNLRVLSPNDGYSLALWVELQDDFLPDIGLRRLTELHLDHIQNYSLHDIPLRFPCIMWLLLSGKPGFIRDVNEITKLPELEKLAFWDLFGFSADEFPRPESLPELRSIFLESVPAETGKIIKKLYKGRIQEVLTRKLRSVEWLHENLNNPLRNWDGNEFVPKSKYNKSVALWKETRRRMMEEASHAELDMSAVKRIAIDYVEGFNKLDRRSQFIESEEREDIFKAFEQILNETGLSDFKEEIMQFIDEKRNW